MRRELTGSPPYDVPTYQPGGLVKQPVLIGSHIWLSDDQIFVDKYRVLALLCPS